MGTPHDPSLRSRPKKRQLLDAPLGKTVKSPPTQSANAATHPASSFKKRRLTIAGPRKARCQYIERYMIWPFRNWLLGVQCIEQHLGLLKVERAEAFGELTIGRSELTAGLIQLALVATRPRHAHRRSQFPGFCLLLACDRERTLEIRLHFCRIR